MFSRCCVPARFTQSNILAQQPYGHQETLYGCEDGSLFAFNYNDYSARKLWKFNSAILTIVSQERDCFVGLMDGSVFLVPGRGGDPDTIGSMGAPVIRLYIFGDGLQRFLYAASGQNRLDGFSMGEVRRSFCSRGNSMSQQSLNVSEEKSVEHSIERKDSMRRSTKSDTQKIAMTTTEENESILETSIRIQPAFSVRFDSATATFLHGCQHVLAYCSRDGEVRFYSKLSQQMLLEFNLGESYPVSCHVYERPIQGQKLLFCDIGYQSGAAVSLNIKYNAAKPIQFFEALNPEDAPKRVEKKQKMSRKLGECPIDTQFSLEEIQLDNGGDVNEMLNIIDIEDSQPGKSTFQLQPNTFDRSKIREVQFQNGIRAIRHREDIIQIADEAFLFCFQRHIVSAASESYILVKKVPIDPGANRLEFGEFDDEIFIYGCYNLGKVFRASFDGDQWCVNWQGRQ